ncbi:MAG TPA: hypothetical protein VFF30_13110 [Nitrososphaerales archaeon]|nr:hypothetical protein [Nitrososphaerales archaeon]
MSDVVHDNLNKEVTSLSKQGSVSGEITFAKCGGYNRHLTQMAAKISECRKLGIRVLIS